MPCKNSCWDENHCLVDSMQSCFNRSPSFHSSSKLIQYPMHLKLIQCKLKSLFCTKVYDTWQSEFIYRIPTLTCRIGKWYWTICSTVRLDWLPFKSGWFQRLSLSHSASRKSSKTSRQTSFCSFWDDSLLIDSNHAMRTWKDFHWDIFIPVHFCYEMTLVCIKLISVCVESTLDVYWNTCSLPFVLKRCFKMSVTV